ncbi:SPASM domain-containing protein [Telmatospirillum siberiense]|uniref:SPASM domain-containing protein n=1 Tax=Telmatospirillum siberiense TaxID=382514 RepID=UPI00130461DB|nr:SPASM domain-containing protein [Telmatospirillum siberiense]
MAQFCPRPFDRLEISLNGDALLCHSTWIIGNAGNLTEQSLDEVWNSAAARTMRESVHDQSFRFCLRARCPHLATLPEAERQSDPDLRAIAADRQVTLERRPSRLVLSYAPSSATRWSSGVDEAMRAADNQRRAVVTDRLIAGLQFWNTPRSIAVVGPGDPLASPHMLRILHHLAERERGPLRLDIQTNAQNLSEQTWRLLSGLERYDLGLEVTLDAVWPWSEDHRRSAVTWEALSGALDLAASLRRNGRLRRLAISMTVETASLPQMPTMVELGQTLHCDRVIFSPIAATAFLPQPAAARKIADPSHPDHGALREMLRNPMFSDPIVDLTELSKLRG